MGGLLDGLDRPFGEVVVDDQLDFHFGQKIDDVFGAAIQLGMALLPAETFRLDDRQPLKADLVQGFFDFVEFERFDNCLDFLHRPDRSPMGWCAVAQPP